MVNSTEETVHQSPDKQLEPESDAEKIRKLKEDQKNGQHSPVTQNGSSALDADNAEMINGKENGSGAALHGETLKKTEQDEELGEAMETEEAEQKVEASTTAIKTEADKREEAKDNGANEDEKNADKDESSERPPPLEGEDNEAEQSTQEKKQEHDMNGGIDALSLLRVDRKSSTPNPAGVNGITAKKIPEPECIELDDEEDDSQKPPAKRKKLDDDIEILSSDKTTKPAVKDAAAPAGTAEKEVKKEKTPELTSPEALLNKLEEYIADAIDNKKSVERKILDALLGAINVQVQKEPLSVRRLILDKQLVLPNTISFPPSQVVDLLIEHDPDHPLTKVINRMFGDEKPRLSEAEKKEKAALKLTSAAPNFTKLLLDIGQDLVQEATYCDIVHARNLPETPKNIETYKQVAAQLKPVWESLRKKNEPYKMKLHECKACGFKSESWLVLQQHCSVIHSKNGKFQCALCDEFDSSEQRMLNHYLECHCVIASKEEQQAKYPCLICEQDFQFKGLRDQHMKVCKKDYIRARQIMMPRAPDDHLMVQTWLWPRPTVDPTILSQQQAAQQQAKRQQLAQAQMTHQQVLHRQQQQAAQRISVNAAAAQAAMLQQQMLQAQQQQRLKQQLHNQSTMFQSSSQGGSDLLRSNSLLQAMQKHLIQTQQAQQAAARGSPQASSSNMLNSQTIAAAAALYQKSIQAAQANKQQAAAQQALKRGLQGVSGINAAAMQKAFASFGAAGNLIGASTSSAGASSASSITCEICDQAIADRERYFNHLQMFHKQMRGKSYADMQQGGAPLACSRCRERFHTYEGLERHLVMAHGLVTADLLTKAQKKEDGGRCKLCGKQYAFNILQHLVADHQIKLCSAEIMYSCDVCFYKCNTYSALESHLSTNHPKTGGGGQQNGTSGGGKGAEAGEGDARKNNKNDCITLDDD